MLKMYEMAISHTTLSHTVVSITHRYERGSNC